MARTATKDKPSEIELQEIELPQVSAKLAPSESGNRRQITVHHMTRGLASFPDGGNFTADQLDEHCQTWLDQGYELLEWYPTYIVPEQGPTGQTVTEAQWHILYLFVKYEEV